MAITADGLENVTRGNLTGKGFVLSGLHARMGDLAYAVGVGVVNELHASALVIVPTHAGGTYKVTGLSESGMRSKIIAALQSRGIVFSGTHSRAHVMPEAIASAVTSEVLSKCQVSIPYDGSGTFQIIGMSAGALEEQINNGLRAENFNLERGDSGLTSAAIAASVASEINSKAVVSGGFAGGGVFPVL